jgi:arginase family enzyme
VGVGLGLPTRVEVFDPGLEPDFGAGVAFGLTVGELFCAARRLVAA